MKKSRFVSLYVRDSRTIDLAIKKGLQRYIKKELKYYYLTYCCYHGGRQFKSRSKGLRPNQRYLGATRLSPPPFFMTDYDREFDAD